MKSFNISSANLGLSLQDVYEAMGYGKAYPDPTICLQTEILLEESHLHVRPSGYFLLSESEIYSDFITVDRLRFNTGKTICQLMKQSEYIAVFVATAGLEFESWRTKAEKKEDPIADFIMDSIGTCIVEKAGDYLEQELEKVIGKDMKHTNRFSPGYCGWDIKEQKKLFAFFPEGTTEITLSESCLMFPIKSISGIIGIGKKVKTKKYSCQVCDMQNCYRKK